MSRRRVSEDNENKTSHHNKRPCSGITSYDRYTVAWLCALHIEMAAARAMLDEKHDSPPKTDTNSYVLGTIQRQNVVIACLPASAYGTNNAAIVMSNLKRTFPNIDICLMVGIGGGVPTKADIRLGDIVVGTRVMQYDLGKTMNGGFQRTGVYKHPGSSILTVISNLRSRHELEGSRVPTILKNKMENHPIYGLPTEPDHLFESSYNHPCPEFSCDECDQDRLEVRKTRISIDPVIHYGAIASSNQVMKDATCRDKIARELDILCFEMEAAGLMDIESCLPIRGICDYSDSHKAKGWQRYAAATAAAYAYELLQVRGQDSWEGGVDNTDDEEKGNAEEERLKRILESFNFGAIDARKTTINAAHSKTCQWFLDHKDYLAWKDPTKVSEHHGFLWIRGKPGAGKSTMMKFIYLENRKIDEENQVLTASFFFNARGEFLEKTISGMYRSLLLQLLKGFPDLQCVLNDPDIIPRNQITCPSLNCLKELLRNAVLKLGERSFTCFIDAVDECDEQQVMDLVSFFEDVAEACTENGVRLRICFSSRHYPYIDIDRGMRLTIENQDGHASDLESYIKSKLKIKDPKLVAELQEKMLVKASGVFLWVVLVVDVLNDENRRGRLNLRKRLEQIPNGLSELFKDILGRDKTNAEELQLCLLWILLSKRPLRPDEYYHALWSGLYLKGLADNGIPSIDTTDAADCFYKSVISSSKGLAEVTKSLRPTVQFIHESVRDFLIKDNGLAEMWPELKADWEGFGHEKLKHCCSLYFQLCVAPKDEFNESDVTMDKKYPFVEYASRCVLYHADSAAGTCCQEKFLRDFPTGYWIGIVNEVEGKIHRYTRGVELLYVLVDRRYLSLIRTRVKSDPRIDLPCLGERYIYPLIAAMARGHKDSVLALLGLSSPLHEGVDIVDGMAPTIQSECEDRTPLAWACEHGYLGIAKLLVQRGASTYLKHGWTLLMHAAKGGSIETVKWLIDLGQDIRTASTSDSAISLAVENCHAEVVRLLLDLGIEPDSLKPGGRPILFIALERGDETVARIILGKGANVEVVDSFGRRPIHYAKSKAELAALIEHGADINAPNNQGETCLWGAIGLGELDFLIKNNADVDRRDDQGETCLFAAVRQGNVETVDVLCKGGANVNAQNDQGDTCLHTVRTSLRPSPQLYTILVNYAEDANARDSEGQTFLHHIVDPSGLTFVPFKSTLLLQILGRQGIDINARDNDGNTPLHLSSRRSRAGTLGIWLRHGADINSRNNQGETPVDIAMRYRNKVGSSLLIQRGGMRGSEIDSV